MSYRAEGHRTALLRRDAASETPVSAEPSEGGRDGDSSEDGGLRARLSPLSGRDAETDAVQVTVYVVTGYHGKLRVPESFCRECHMFTRRAEQAIEQVDTDVHLSVRSWWTHFPWALRRGGYHPPVMVVGDKRLCQGHDVPTTEGIVDAIELTKAR